MKFSVWDYSQIKIAQFNTSHPSLAIDPTDIFIFTWFKGFATKTKSKSSENTHSKGMWTKTIDGVDYFNIRYEAIIKDFPILSFTSVKSIQRRFDKYIEAGIFVKKIIYSGKKGNFTYFAFTDLFWSFEYDNNNPEHKPVGADNSVRTKSLGADNSVQTKSLGVDNSVQTKSLGADNSVQTKSLGADNSVQTKPVGVDNSVQTKSLGVDNSVQTKPVGVDNSVQTKPVGADNSVQTKTLGVDNSVQTLINNPITSLNNPTTTSSREINFIPKENTDSFMQEEAEVFNNTIIKLFGYNPRFSPDPFPNLIQTMISCDVEINLMPKYVEWIYSELKPKCKNPDSFVSYFYKSFTQPCHIARYGHILQKKQKKAEDIKNLQILCPICGTVHDKRDYVCPNENCNFPRESLEEQEEINRSKAIYFLKTKDTAKFEEYQSAINILYGKIPITERLENKDKRLEFENQFSEIESRFLNI